MQYITQAFSPYLSGGTAIGFDVASEAAVYAARGLSRDNAYLHVRGHNIYELTAYIGRMLSTPLRISFESDVMKNPSIGGDYWEYAKIEEDLRSV